jgi:hypothetical protein
MPKTYTIAARLIDRRAGTVEHKTVEAKTVRCDAGGWYFFEIDHNGESIFSDHGAMRKSGLILDAQDGPLDFIL